MERRLTAVMIADVAGYSRLSQVDDEGTRARFQSDLHHIFEPSIAGHHGRLVKTMGDGLLVDFHSVVDALRCAIEMQRAKAAGNVDTSADRRLEFRIGINLGDLIVEGEDIHGDGVNIAARLQALAEPGGIVVSGTAYDHIKGKVDAGFEFLGEQRVKNIAEPVRIYRVLIDPGAAGKTIGTAKRTRLGRRKLATAAAVPLIAIACGTAVWLIRQEPSIEAASVEHMALPLPNKPSIAVLPFANMSDDPKQEYFADGITDDLITELSKVSGLFVISRNSTFVYKGRAIPPKQVSEELGIRYVLEGSVQRAGDRLRINAQLIDAISGGHEWADRFDGSLADVFALQDKVTRTVADALAIRLTASDQSAIDQHETSVPEAYDAFLRGWEHFRRETPEDYARAIPYFEEATRLDSKYGRAYAALAVVYLLSYDLRWNYSLGISDIEARLRGERYLREAQQHPTVLSRQAAAIDLWIDKQPDKALAELKEATALEPGDSLTYAYMGAILTASGRPEEGIRHLRTALRLDPRYAPSHYFLGLAQLGTGDFEDAAVSLASATGLNPDYEFGFAALAAAYGQLGRKEDALSAIARFNELSVARGDIPLTIATVPSGYFARTTNVRQLSQGLRLAGVPEYLASSEFARQNRLTADEIRVLIFGHQLHGRSLRTGKTRTASITKDGIADLAGDWNLLGDNPLTGGVVSFEGDRLCYKFDFVSYCGEVFRNPGGTKAKENEFIWYNGEAFTFSPTG
jgi:adenylate cyclase